MKIQMTFKSPDVVYNSLRDAGIDPNEPPIEVEDLLETFIKYDEYVTIEFDTEQGTATVVPN